ncbi:hypothetical protein EVG20_g6860 [Dentipellis fragilis]|uniref:Uncharacterized protein n=1 Tax=Dentipellis fragilis TaxID=205917 RepID=A0A4Y9YKH6_9AGAM|nr:hypothetical protein EVG20_g6860 [Dentipellis fragilis]
MFEVVPQFPPATVHEAVDFVLFQVPPHLQNATPVFMVEVKPPADLRFSSKRQEADEQLRWRPVDFVSDLKIPVLHGISPRRITSDPEVVTDIAPREWWAYDILEEEGAKKFGTWSRSKKVVFGFRVATRNCKAAESKPAARSPAARVLGNRLSAASSEPSPALLFATRGKPKENSAREGPAGSGRSLRRYIHTYRGTADAGAELCRQNKGRSRLRRIYEVEDMNYEKHFWYSGDLNIFGSSQQLTGDVFLQQVADVTTLQNAAATTTNPAHTTFASTLAAAGVTFPATGVAFPATGVTFVDFPAAGVAFPTAALVDPAAPDIVNGDANPDGNSLFSCAASLAAMPGDTEGGSSRPSPSNPDEAGGLNVVVGIAAVTRLNVPVGAGVAGLLDPLESDTGGRKAVPVGWRAADVFARVTAVVAELGLTAGVVVGRATTDFELVGRTGAGGVDFTAALPAAAAPTGAPARSSRALIDGTS